MMTLKDALAQPTIPVPDAGRLFYGLGRNASYDAANRGDIETITIGGKKRALVAPLAHRVGLKPTLGAEVA